MSTPRVRETTVGDAVRRLRDEQRLSLRTLAERTGVSASFLSQVENAQASPSISSLERIAGALGVTLGQFFGAAEAGASGVVRASSRPVLGSDWSKAHIEALGSRTRSMRLEPVLVTLAAGGSSGRHPYPAPTEEFVLVTAGEVRLTLNAEVQLLGTGDAATIRQGTPRRWENVASEPAQVLVVSLHDPLTSAGRHAVAPAGGGPETRHGTPSRD